jgi:hypothetical protein
MRVKMGRVKGSVSDYRDGAIHLDGIGVTIDGRAVLPEWQRLLIMLAGLAMCVGVLITAILTEYAIRVRRTSVLPWAVVDEIVANRREQRVCVVYREPSKPDKPVSLAFRFDPGVYDHFVQVAQYLAPGKLREGKIGSPSSTAAVLILLAVIIGIAALGIYVSSHP